MRACVCVCAALVQDPRMQANLALLLFAMSFATHIVAKPYVRAVVNMWMCERQIACGVISHVFVLDWVCVFVHVYTYVYSCIHVYLCVRVFYIYIYTLTHIYVRTHIYTYAYIYSHTHTHTYTHIHIQRIRSDVCVKEKMHECERECL